MPRKIPLRIAACFLPFLSAVLLNLAWPPHGFTAGIFIGLVPLILLKKLLKVNGIHYFLLTFAGFLVFHLLAGWWMYSSTIAGSLMAHMFNALYMAFVFFLWSKYDNLPFTSSISGFFSLIIFWLSFEMLHLHWELSWPWFHLGNAFSAQPQWIQWYQFTGVLGGSLWVLIVNLFLAYGIVYWVERSKQKAIKAFALGGLFIFFPIIASLLIPQNQLATHKLHVLIVQPDINPRTEKFNGLTQSEQIDQATQLIQENQAATYDLIVLPETFITQAVDEDSLHHSLSVSSLIHSVEASSATAIITGVFTTKSAQKAGSDIAAIIDADRPYVLYNSALLYSDADFQLYHKSQLVPLVEKQPFYGMMKPLQSFIESSGGFFGRYGTAPAETVFRLNDSTLMAPLICFESVYGYQLTKQIKQGAGFIVLLTNDGWWNTSGGYQQHLHYARLRCIESGRWMVRAANTGVSAIIDHQGHIVRQTNYGQKEVIAADVAVYSGMTLYARLGDYIGIIALGGCLLILLQYLLIKYYRRRQSFH